MDVIRWNQNFEEIQRYLAENNCKLEDVPKSVRASNGTVMRVWIAEMRKAYRGLKSTHFHLDDEQKEKLRSIGMEEWINRSEHEWLSRLSDVKAFYEEHHHFSIPTEIMSGKIVLYNWIVKQRSDFKKGIMPKEHIQKIQEYGLMEMVAFRSTPFENGFHHAKMFYEKYHHLQVPEDFKCEDGYQLGNWITKMRYRFFENRLSQRIIRKLNKIGMDWTLKDCEYIKDYQQAQHFFEEFQAETVIEKTPKPEKNNAFQTMNTQDFEVGYYHAEWFYQENQHLFVPSTFVCEDGFRLGVWIYNQRYKFEKNQLLPEEIEKLNQIEMIWNLSDYFWNSNYQDCKVYFEEHGNLDIPSNFKGKSRIFLADWIQECREEYQKGNLSPEQIEKLLEIEVLNFLSEEEKNLFSHLEKFYQVHQHLCIPPKFICEDDYPLGNEVSQIRTKYRKEEVSEYFAEKLENIGFCWDYKDQIWMDTYRFCKQYREEHGNLQIPLDWKSPSGTNVRVWLKLNRISYYKGELSPKRAKLLEEIGGTVYIMPRKFKSLKELQKCQKGKIQPEFDAWQNYCMELRKFYENYHHLSISADVKGADRIPLKYWFISQKNQLKLGRMPENKVLFLKQHQMLELFQSNIINGQ